MFKRAIGQVQSATRFHFRCNLQETSAARGEIAQSTVFRRVQRRLVRVAEHGRSVLNRQVNTVGLLSCRCKPVVFLVLNPWNNRLQALQIEILVGMERPESTSFYLSLVLAPIALRQNQTSS